MSRIKFGGITLLLTFMVGLLLAACGGGGGGGTAVTGGGVTTATFTTGQAASVVIGQPDFNGTMINQPSGVTAANNITWPWGNPFVSNGTLYLPDSGNNRTLVYNTIPTTNGAAADFAIGQAYLASAVWGASASSVNGPQQVSIYNGKLAVTEYGNSRVDIYNTIPTSGPGAIDVVVGQPNKAASGVACTRNGLNLPESSYMAAGKLVVADTRNNRVMIWKSIPAMDGAPADLVLGQTDFISCAPNGGGAPNASNFNFPTAIWTDGTRLAVVDGNDSRVLIWNSFPTASNQPADLVLGQPNFTNVLANVGGAASAPSASSLNNPWDGVFSNGIQLFVADQGNNRVLIWNSFPTTIGQPADVVLGQINFASSVAASGVSGFNWPAGVFLYGKQLIVPDSNNNRYLIFNGQ